MDLKFSFGASNPLPLSNSGLGSTAANSSVLELHVSLAADTSTMRCEGRSGDGVSYATAEKHVAQLDPATLAAALRSVLARAGAELPEPLIDSVSAIVLTLDGQEAAIVKDLGLAVAEGTAQLATVDATLQSRTGVAAGTPIRIAA